MPTQIIQVGVFVLYHIFVPVPLLFGRARFRLIGAVDRGCRLMPSSYSKQFSWWDYRGISKGEGRMAWPRTLGRGVGGEEGGKGRRTWLCWVLTITPSEEEL